MTKARDLANGGFGLVLVKPSSVVGGTDNGKGTVNFTASTSIRLNGVFNSTYDIYRVELNVPTSSTGGSSTMQFSTNNSVNSTSNYNNATWTFRSGNGQQVETANESNTTSAVFATIGNGATYSLDIFNPFSSSFETVAHGTGILISGSAGYRMLSANHGTRFASAVSFDGISIGFANAQTGTVSVYGYNK